MIPTRERPDRLSSAACGLLAAVLAAALSACSTGATGSGPPGTITLSFLSYNFGTADLGGQGTQELIDTFERANPSIKIAPQGVAVKDTLTKARASAAGGAPFDVAQIGWSKIAEAYQTLPVVPVQQIPPPQEWEADIAGFNQTVLRATERNGVVTAMPYTMSIPTLFYNEALWPTPASPTSSPSRWWTATVAPCSPRPGRSPWMPHPRSARWRRWPT